MPKVNVMGFAVPSTASIDESKKLMGMSENQIADEYLVHPPLPYNEHITIDKIGVLNFDLINKKPLGILKYGALRMKKPDLFPKCKDPQMDFEDDEQVSPVVIISGDKKYRTDQVLWFPLSDVVRDIMMRQTKSGRKLLPLKVFLDEKNQWMVPLLNLSKGLMRPQQ